MNNSTRISAIEYNKDFFEERRIKSPDELLPDQTADKDTITLMLVEGLAETDIASEIGKAFGIHPLVVEDILNTHQRPKFEEYDEYLFIVLKCLLPEEGHFAISYEQISLLVLDNFVLVFKEKEDGLLAPVMERIRMSKGRLRRMGTDYLAYVILDTIVDSHFVLLDLLDDTVESIEDDLFNE
ncbi:MAG: magnesium and cobalt transport protein CorA, partial [Candidatus Electrothrix sp. ATG1]|nr:magnesium and cobalt transport protein CorA [Candidatus Electrothrix sp. ATG1]